jgi:hypothetical protein
MKLKDIEEVAKNWPIKSKEARDYLQRLTTLTHTPDDLNKLSLSLVYMPKFIAIAKAAKHACETHFTHYAKSELGIALSDLEEEQ